MYGRGGLLGKDDSCESFWPSTWITVFIYAIGLYTLDSSQLQSLPFLYYSEHRLKWTETFSPQPWEVLKFYLCYIYISIAQKIKTIHNWGATVFLSEEFSPAVIFKQPPHTFYSLSGKYFYACPYHHFGPFTQIKILCNSTQYVTLSIYRMSYEMFTVRK